MVTDRDSGPATQIRDDSYPIQTESLEQAGDEVVPDEAVAALLTREWIPSEATRRPFVTPYGDAYQANLRDGPVVVVQAEDYRAEPVGHRHEFERVEIPVSLMIKTIRSRQEMWNVAAECRRIIYRWMLAFQPWHCIYWDGFRPDPDCQPNDWHGVARIRLTAEPIPIFLRRVKGEEAPNTDPGLFPDGI